MKLRALTLAAALALPFAASAAEPVKFEVYLGGELKHSISLAGPHSKFKFSPAGLADTTLEFRLIAPEPLILEMTESTANNTAPENVGRISLIKPGSSVTVSDIKGTHFKHPYVLVRAE
ncbi:hypothetical protein PTW32_11360 [Dechloromonas agitata]|uniref:Uncharacterized protein n=1 Tax=Dechloromonas agitata TaxID=73030 RepID=A0A930BVG7_9RHOO|nr:hypothetical protein [Dechloromonas agitata]MBF1166449.1 hypothetical protein [Dechloromonas agitata]MDE1546015.1 hypothetical protein [Dechloromonas agitata]